MIGNNEVRNFPISVLADDLDVSARSIRLYEKKGLISSGLSKTDLRVYGKSDRARLRLIARGERSGYTPDELAGMIGKTTSGIDEVEEIRRSLEYAEKRLNTIKERGNALPNLEQVIITCDIALLGEYVEELRALYEEVPGKRAEKSYITTKGKESKGGFKKSDQTEKEARQKSRRGPFWKAAIYILLLSLILIIPGASSYTGGHPKYITNIQSYWGEVLNRIKKLIPENSLKIRKAEKKSDSLVRDPQGHTLIPTRDTISQGHKVAGPEEKEIHKPTLPESEKFNSKIHENTSLAITVNQALAETTTDYVAAREPVQSIEKKEEGLAFLGNKSPDKRPEEVRPYEAPYAEKNQKAAEGQTPQKIEVSHREVSYSQENNQQSTNHKQEAPLSQNKKLIIYFGQNSKTLSDDTCEDIDRLAVFISQHPDPEIKIRGYTDSTGNYLYNMNLSKLRADEVKRYLEGKVIRFTSIESFGLGPHNPIQSNDTAAGRKANRRVEIEINH